jgi:mannose-6-phosphate isomerase-like protein (cupin superfamily)
MTTINAYEATFGPSSEKEGGASVPFARVMGKEAFQSDLRWVDLCIVKPRAQIGVHEHHVDDEIYYILRGTATMVVNGEERAVAPGDCILLRCGGWHGLRNDSDDEVHVLVVDLLLSSAEASASEAAGGQGAWANVAAVPMVTRASSMGGIGHIQVGHLFTREQLGPSWDFCEVVVVPPGSSIGTHEHRGTEEIYYFLAGQGAMTIDGQSVAFGPDTVSLCRSGSGHELLNRGDGDVRLLAIQVPVR